MPIEVIDYDPAWPALFAQLRDRMWPVVSDAALAIEHVGSTSVPGLAAKPVIDIDVIVANAKQVPRAIERLATLGYDHLGDLGIPQREAFRAPADLPRHNLYVTIEGCEALRNHRAVRDYLRVHSESAREYGELKKYLARTVDHDIDRYVEGKSDFSASVLAASEAFSEEELDDIRRRNEATAPARLRMS